jgi:NADPH:quinone reductase-like Zn-dependent oxidoreductase
MAEAARGHMRAVVHDRHGPPEVLRIAEVDRPLIKEDAVLVRVHASTVTRGDAMGVRCVEYRFTRVFTGIRRPRRTIFGSEFAGRVEEVGGTVTELRVGDEVLGFTAGARAEYVSVPETGVIASKPSRLTFEEAAAVPDGSLLCAELFVVDCETLLRIAAGEIDVAAEHKLVAPTLVRSQALSGL